MVEIIIINSIDDVNLFIYNISKVISSIDYGVDLYNYGISSHSSKTLRLKN